MAGLGRPRLEQGTGLGMARLGQAWRGMGFPELRLRDQTKGQNVDTFIETATARTFDPRDPEGHTYHISDIACALAGQCRYSGTTIGHYSIAEHSLLIYEHLRAAGADNRTLRAALLHDAAEAYLGDVPAPVKAFLPDYRAMEDRIMRAIAKQFDFDWPKPAAVAEADRRILKDERLHAVGVSRNSWACDDYEPLGVRITFMGREEAGQKFEKACRACAD